MSPQQTVQQDQGVTLRADAAETAAPQCRDLAVDQAVFTSIKSFGGSGYRIVSVSPGVKVSERSEITRWSPSHGSLCAGEAIASYPLTTGRRVVAYSCPAGPEPSARGGECVYTQLLLLTKADYAKFSWDPVAVYRAARGQLPSPLPNPPNVLPQLPISLAACEPTPLSRSALRAACTAAAAVLSGQKIAALTPEFSLDLLEWTLLALPPSRRAGLCVSAGLTLSPGRPMDLAWVTGQLGPLQRAVQGHAVSLLDCSRPQLPRPTGASGWFEFIQRWAQQGLHSELLALLELLDEEVKPADLRSIAEICHDFELAGTADAAHLESLRRKYLSRQGLCATERLLMQELRAMLDERAGTRQ